MGSVFLGVVLTSVVLGDPHVYEVWTNADCHAAQPNTVIANIGVIVTPAAAAKWNTKRGVVAELKSILVNVNRVFIRQMSIMFNVTTVVAPVESAFATCSGDMAADLDAAQAWIHTEDRDPRVGNWYIFSYCPNADCSSSCAVGGTRSTDYCGNPYLNSAIVFLTGDSTWITLAHEIGHNIGGEHPFGDNRDLAGSFGGLMDYHDNDHRGIPQFNGLSNRANMCEGIELLLVNCDPSVFSITPAFVYNTIYPDTYALPNLWYVAALAASTSVVWGTIIVANIPANPLR